MKIAKKIGYIVITFVAVVAFAVSKDIFLAIAIAFPGFYIISKMKNI